MQPVCAFSLGSELLHCSESCRAAGQETVGSRSTLGLCSYAERATALCSLALQQRPLTDAAGRCAETKCTTTASQVSLLSVAFSLMLFRRAYLFETHDQPSL